MNINEKQKDILANAVSKGTKKIEKCLDQHIDRVLDVRKGIAVKNSSLVTDELTKHIPALRWYVKGRIKKLRADLQDTIQGIASEHEKRRFEPLSKNFAELNGVSKFNLERGEAILENERQMFISYHSLFFACKVCAEVNTSLLKSIENERYGGKKDGKELELLLKNALIVYETTSMIIGMIQGFQLKGLQEFQLLRDTVFKDLSEAESNSQRNVVQANNPAIQPSQREETILRHRNLMESAMYVRVQWQRFEDQIMSMQQNAAAIAQRLPSLALTRDNAKVQLDFLELVAVTQMMDQNIQAIEGLASLELTLAPLSPYDVCRLLGLETVQIASNNAQ